MAGDPLARVRRAAAKSRKAKDELRTAIREANEERTMREIGEAAGLSATRVYQIVHGK
jgi:hypothetical protein